METIEKSTNFIQEAIEKDLEDRVSYVRLFYWVL